MAKLTFGQQLRQNTAGSRLVMSRMGKGRSFTDAQKDVVADAFEADKHLLSARKTIIDTKTCPEFKACTAIVNAASKTWWALTVPYTEPGVRLISRSRIEALDVTLNQFQAALAEAAAELAERWEEIIDLQRSRLGTLFDVADYAFDPAEQWGLAWDYPNLEPPDYLKALHPDLWEQEQRRVSARFDQAVQLAEQAYIEELDKFVSNLSDRLQVGDDGKPKIFKDSSIDGLREFFQRFKDAPIKSNEALESIIEEAEEMLSGVTPKALRQDLNLRADLQKSMAVLEEKVGGLMVDRPRRKFVRDDAA
jgi:hypothetical protein